MSELSQFYNKVISAFLSKGNVGIGTAPTTKTLEVNGTFGVSVLSEGSITSAGSGGWAAVYDFSSEASGYAYSGTIALLSLGTYSLNFTVHLTDYDAGGRVFLEKHTQGGIGDLRMKGKVLEYQQNSGTVGGGVPFRIRKGVAL